MTSNRGISRDPSDNLPMARAKAYSRGFSTRGTRPRPLHTSALGGPNVPCCLACLWDANANIEGVPAKNQRAMRASKIMHPNDDAGIKGQIGLPQKWCTRSQQECVIQAN